MASSSTVLLMQSVLVFQRAAMSFVVMKDILSLLCYHFKLTLFDLVHLYGNQRIKITGKTNKEQLET